MIFRILTFLLITLISFSQTFDILSLAREKVEELLTQKIDIKIKTYDMNDCLKFRSRLYPNGEKYDKETQENKQKKMVELCKPCLVSSFSGWCINCCREFYPKRKRTNANANN